MNAKDVSSALARVASPEKARLLAGFFKTGPGQYGEGDVFIGVKVPEIRAVARRFAGMGWDAVEELFMSPVHEERLCALMVLVMWARKADGVKRGEILDFYLAHTGRVNNWDLVDLSAPEIVGVSLLGGDWSVLKKLAASENLWERRIAIVSTLAFIRAGQSVQVIEISRMLLCDRHDLIYKAVGWMLREVGKRDQAAEEAFLARHCGTMPRTMLRYAIEKFPERTRRAYLVRRGRTGRAPCDGVRRRPDIAEKAT